MNRTLLLFFICIGFQESIGQVVFCPPGAEWRSNFAYYQIVNWSGYRLVHTNTTMKYKKDSVVNGYNAKFITYPQFYKGSCPSGSPNGFLRQNGDTIFFFCNETKGTWQILYNFATPAGSSWHGKTWDNQLPYCTYTVMVTLVDSIIINNIQLRRLKVNCTVDNIMYGYTGSGTLTITERIGDGQYLFYFNSMDCDGPVFNNFLCYTDNTLGTYQASSKPCNYTYVQGFAGVDESRGAAELLVSPNPMDKKLTIELDSYSAFQGRCEIKVLDILGAVVLESNLHRVVPRHDVDVSGLLPGIYSVVVLLEGKLIAMKKLIKE